MEWLPPVNPTVPQIPLPPDTCIVQSLFSTRLKPTLRGLVFAWLGCMLVFWLYVPVHAKTPADIVVVTQDGRVNWSRGYMQAHAVKSPDPQTKPQDAAAMALARARLNLIRLAGTIRMDTLHQIRDLENVNAAIGPGVAHMVNKLPVFGQQYLSDGTVRITLRMRLFGGFSQLVLPAEIKSIEPIHAVVAAHSEKSLAFGNQPSLQLPARYTGLVVDARGTAIEPALFPHIMDENGREVYGSAFVGREFAVQQGISGYFTNLQSALECSRVKGHPLVVKAVHAGGPGKSDVIISHVDAARLLSFSEHLAFLRECRVVIVVSDRKQRQGES